MREEEREIEEEIKRETLKKKRTGKNGKNSDTHLQKKIN